MPFFDHSTANVTCALAALRECAEIPVAAKTITAYSCCERNFRPTCTPPSAEWIENAGIPFGVITLTGTKTAFDYSLAASRRIRRPMGSEFPTQVGERLRRKGLKCPGSAAHTPPGCEKPTTHVGRSASQEELHSISLSRPFRPVLCGAYISNKKCHLCLVRSTRPATQNNSPRFADHYCRNC